MNNFVGLRSVNAVMISEEYAVLDAVKKHLKSKGLASNWPGVLYYLAANYKENHMDK